MRLRFQHLFCPAGGALLILAGIIHERAIADGGQSTVRTVSVAGSANQSDGTRRFSPSTPVAASEPSSSLRANASAPTSSVAFVATIAPPEPAERHWVQQVQYTATAPASAPPAETKSTIVRSPYVVPSSEPAPQATNEESKLEQSNSEHAGAVSTPLTTPTPPKAAVAEVAAETPAKSTEQRPARPKIAMPVTPIWPQADPQLTNQTRQALDFYGGFSARATLSQFPRRPAIRSASSTPAPVGPQGKPFQSIQPEPTISPYLNLNRNENDGEALPNYYAFVRPQLEQQEANHRQQAEIQRLQRQVQGGSPTSAGRQSRGGAQPEAKSAARFMDTAQFYGGWQR